MLLFLVRSIVELFNPKRNEVFVENPISRFSNPKGRIAPQSIDFEGFREYTGSMND